MRRHFLAKDAKSAKETQDVFFLFLGDLCVLGERTVFVDSFAGRGSWPWVQAFG